VPCPELQIPEVFQPATRNHSKDSVTVIDVVSRPLSRCDLLTARSFDDAKRLGNAAERALEGLSIGRGHNHYGAPQSVSSFSVAG
jgi:hypothetical protein